MARSRRTRFVPRGTRRQARPRLDWVYHEDSYSNDTFDLSAGDANAEILTLIDSQNAMRYITGGAILGPPSTTVAPATITGEWMRPREARIKIHAVEWMMFAIPGTWATTAQVHLGVRLGMFPQDPATGLSGVPINWGIWNTPALGTGITAAGNANIRKYNIKEWRFRYTADTSINDPILLSHGFWRGRWAIGGEDDFALYVASLAGSPLLRTRIYARTLVEMPRT